MQALQKQVGRRVREIRETKGLSQEALAGICNLHRTYIGLIERGERNLSVKTVAVVAAGLEVAPAELFSGIERSPSPRRRSKQPPPSEAADLAAHVATIRQILIEAKLTDEPRYKAIYKANATR
jgi:transcriptional regulator with XRE-family HTH domain